MCNNIKNVLTALDSEWTLRVVEGEYIKSTLAGEDEMPPEKKEKRVLERDVNCQ